MKILFLVTHPIEGASSRHRVHLYLPFLQKSGIQYAIHSFLSKNAFKKHFAGGIRARRLLAGVIGMLKRVALIFKIPFYDVVFIHQESTPLPTLFIERWIQLLRIPIIYDFDDAIFLEREHKNSQIRDFLKSYKKVPKLISMSSHVIVCNRYLQEFCEKHQHPERISILPTTIDYQQYQRSKPLNPTPVIGWVGSPTTYPYLINLFSMIEELAKHHKFIFKIVGAIGKAQIPGVHIVQKPWKLEDEIDDFLSLDIGLYPLSTSDWAKGKAGFKAIQYMGSGVACVASNLGHNKEVIQNGHNGFLVNNSKEWSEKIGKLLTQPELRQKIATNGYETVQNTFDVRVQAPKMIHIIRQAAKH